MWKYIGQLCHTPEELSKTVTYRITLVPQE